MDPIEILHSDQLFLEVVRLEVFVGAKAKDLLLLELFHENLFHLSVGQLAIVIEAQCLYSPISVLIQFNLVLDHIHACFEDALILDSLPDYHFAGAGARALGGMGAGGLSCVIN